MLPLNKRIRKTAHFFVAAIFLTSTILPTIARAETDKERAQKFAVQLQTSMTSIEDSDRDAARDRWDPTFIVQSAGIEPAQLFSWVKNNVTWEPYHGALRGPIGVLMDRK